MPDIAATPQIDRLVKSGAPVAIGVSGGKDSQACALATFDHLDRIGHTGPRLLVHADLGSVEWNASLPACHALAEKLGCDLVVVRRKAGGLMQRWQSRWHSSRTRYEALSTVTLVPCWSTPGMRFCTSEMKTHVITAELKRRFKGQAIINVTGIRRQESARRAQTAIAGKSADGRLIHWRPIANWSTDDVFGETAAHGQHPHPAYTDFGMSRVSCRFCIMQNLDDMVAATRQPEAHGIYREMVGLEIDSTFAFQGARWLGDIAPHLLSAEDRAGLADAKDRAARRVAAEARITKEMRYVAGWPTRMLTDSEADCLAEVRTEVSGLMGFRSDFLTRDAIHGRYADLLAQQAAKRKTGAGKPRRRNFKLQTNTGVAA